VAQTETPIAPAKPKKPKKPPTFINAFQYRLYPTPTQVAKLEHVLNTHCNLYNDALRDRTAEYALTKRSLTYMDQQGMVPGRIRSGDIGTTRNSMVQTIRRIDAAVNGFVKRVVKWRASGSPEGVELGYPESVDLDDFKSVMWAPGEGAKWMPERQRVRITPDVGEIKAVVHRPHQGTIKTITITRRDRRWFVTLTCDLGAIPQYRAGRMIGIDLGVSKLAATDDGHFVENPRFFEDSAPRLRAAQQVMEKRKTTLPRVPNRPKLNPETGLDWPKNSRNYHDARIAAANIQRDTASRRRDYIRKAAHGLLQTRDGLPDPVGILVLEDLAIKAMITATNLKMAKEEKARKEAKANGGVVPVVVPDAKGRRPRRGMAKALHDVAMGGVHLALTQLAVRLGVRVILVNPANTSQRCSRCGGMPEVPKTLEVRIHRCAACGYKADRDTNAAQNILALGQEVLRQEEADRPMKEAARLRMEAALLRKQARELANGVAGLDTPADPAETDDEDGDHADLSVPMRLTAWPIPDPTVMIPIGNHAGRKERMKQLVLI
jgi:putative transposase